MRIFWIIFAVIGVSVFLFAYPREDLPQTPTESLLNSSIMIDGEEFAESYVLRSGQSARVGGKIVKLIEAAEIDGENYARFRIEGGVLYTQKEGETKTLESLVITPMSIKNEPGTIGDEVTFSITPVVVEARLLPGQSKSVGSKIVRLISVDGSKAVVKVNGVDDTVGLGEEKIVNEVKILVKEVSPEHAVLRMQRI